jgi:hypothetical protein
MGNCYHWGSRRLLFSNGKGDENYEFGAEILNVTSKLVVENVKFVSDMKHFIHVLLRIPWCDYYECSCRFHPPYKC